MASLGLTLTPTQQRIASIVQWATSDAPRRVLIVVSGIPSQWIELGSGVTTGFLAAAVNGSARHSIVVSHTARHCFTRCRRVYETFIHGVHVLRGMQCGAASAPPHCISWNAVGSATVKQISFVSVYDMMCLVGAMPLADLPFSIRPDLLTGTLRGVADTAAPSTLYLWPNTTHLDLVLLGRKLSDPNSPLAAHTHVTSVVTQEVPTQERIQQWTAAGWTVVDAQGRVKLEPKHEA
jgi:hypothetical protein